MFEVSTGCALYGRIAILWVTTLRINQQWLQREILGFCLLDLKSVGLLFLHSIFSCRLVKQGFFLVFEQSFCVLMHTFQWFLYLYMYIIKQKTKKKIPVPANFREVTIFVLFSFSSALLQFLTATREGKVTLRGALEIE